MNKENKSVEMANLRIYFSDYFGVDERVLERYMRVLRICVVVLSALLVGCTSQLTVFSGGASSPGHCNKRECALGSLYGIDWCGKKNGVNSCEPKYPLARVSTVVRPQDFALAFFTLGMVIPMHIEYDLETSPLPKRNVK